jgi:hypothetical protein
LRQSGSDLAVIWVLGGNTIAKEAESRRVLHRTSPFLAMVGLLFATERERRRANMDSVLSVHDTLRSYLTPSMGNGRTSAFETSRGFDSVVRAPFSGRQLIPPMERTVLGRGYNSPRRSCSHRETLAQVRQANSRVDGSAKQFTCLGSNRSEPAASPSFVGLRRNTYIRRRLVPVAGVMVWP